MVARTRGRQTLAVLFTLAAFAVGDHREATAQLGISFGGKSKSAKSKPAAAKDQAPPESFKQSDIPSTDPTLVPKIVPVNPNDAIALINNEPISRRQLADECVARKGQEILETLIARKLIDQALRARKLDVTAAEIDEEIDRVAENIAHVSRQNWLRTLDKERNISPVQYARDIIYPALALRKLASDRVQVTAKDMKDSFEAQYGDKLRCRLIMVDKLPKANEIWEKLRANPGGFEKLAKDHSMDTGSRSLGGLLAEPITRHAYPRSVSDAASASSSMAIRTTRIRATSPRTATSPVPFRSPRPPGSSFGARRSSPASRST
jgi:foldase protein PrsA